MLERERKDSKQARRKEKVVGENERETLECPAVRRWG